jgi:hypothetical protein
MILINKKMLEKEMESARKNIVITNFAHFTGGFGLALLLQYYLLDNAFLPPIVGWVLVAFTVIVHVFIFISGVNS